MDAEAAIVQAQTIALAGCGKKCPGRWKGQLSVCPRCVNQIIRLLLYAARKGRT